MIKNDNGVTEDDCNVFNREYFRFYVNFLWFGCQLLVIYLFNIRVEWIKINENQ